MPLDEFDLIDRFFRHCGPESSNVVLGIGDDGAILQAGHTGGNTEELVVATDTLVAGTHFPEHGDPAEIAQRALRVNLSDLAAMGAQPTAFLLALTLPEADEQWLSGFAQGLSQAAQTFTCPLIGGDTTKGPLCISITTLGSVPRGQALTRSGARPGDIVYITGITGEARAALDILQGKSRAETNTENHLLARYWRPEPRIAAGTHLRGLASAAIDVSDGLLADLQHIADNSGVGAIIEAGKLPLSKPVQTLTSHQWALQWALTGGDDYELCFTAAPGLSSRIDACMQSIGLPATAIGAITHGQGIVCIAENGEAMALQTPGYRHFGV